MSTNAAAAVSQRTKDNFLSSTTPDERTVPYIIVGSERYCAWNSRIGRQFVPGCSGYSAHLWLGMGATGLAYSHHDRSGIGDGKYP
jgi:hypothetical protein